MRGIEELSTGELSELMRALATREGTATELSKWYDVKMADLRSYAIAHHDELVELREAIAAYEVEKPAESDGEPTPQQLDDLWITKKFERLKRCQLAANLLFKDIETNKLSGSDLSTALREFRSYLTVAANELGQLLHRGAGESAEGDTLSIDIQGVDLNALR